MLWADCRTLLKADDVYLLTNDKAFYCDRNYDSGLAGNLNAELSGANHSFRLFSSLEGLLSEIKSAIPIDKEALLEVYLQQEQPRLNETLASNGFTLGATVRVRPELYVTEDPNVLYLHFSAEIACEDVTDQGRVDARLLLKARGKYDVECARFGELRSSGRGAQLSLARRRACRPQRCDGYRKHCDRAPQRRAYNTPQTRCCAELNR